MDITETTTTKLIMEAESPLKSEAKDAQHVEMIFTVDSPIELNYNRPSWYQSNLDVLFPLFIIGIGLFQYMLRKWILPVPRDLIFDLEDQFPSQAVIYHPGFGVFIMIVGLIMLVLFNLDHIF